VIAKRLVGQGRGIVNVEVHPERDSNVLHFLPALFRRFFSFSVLSLWARRKEDLGEVGRVRQEAVQCTKSVIDSLRCRNIAQGKRPIQVLDCAERHPRLAAQFPDVDFFDERILGHHDDSFCRIPRSVGLCQRDRHFEEVAIFVRDLGHAGASRGVTLLARAAWAAASWRRTRLTP